MGALITRKEVHIGKKKGVTVEIKGALIRSGKGTIKKGKGALIKV